MTPRALGAEVSLYVGIVGQHVALFPPFGWVFVRSDRALSGAQALSVDVCVQASRSFKNDTFVGTTWPQPSPTFRMVVGGAQSWAQWCAARPMIGR